MSDCLGARAEAEVLMFRYFKSSEMQKIESIAASIEENDMLSHTRLYMLKHEMSLK